jgi:hypothetical protein
LSIVCTIYVFANARDYLLYGAQGKPVTNGARGKYNTRSRGDAGIGPSVHGFDGFLHRPDTLWTLSRLEERYQFRVVLEVLCLCEPRPGVDVLCDLLIWW